MSPGNVAGIAAQRRVKCNGLGTESDSQHAATIHGIHGQVCHVQTMASMADVSCQGSFRA